MWASCLAQPHPQGALKDKGKWPNIVGKKQVVSLIRLPRSVLTVAKIPTVHFSCEEAHAPARLAEGKS